MAAVNDIIRQLEREILPLQGFKQGGRGGVQIGFKPIERAFPNNIFPTGAIHEFITSPGDISATYGFVAGLLSQLTKQGSPCLWLGADHIFPPALSAFHLAPEKVIFINAKRPLDALWVMEQALKCDRLAAVVGLIKDIDLTASRRLQLAVEQSNVTGLVIREHTKVPNTIASFSRWRISSLPSEAIEGMPGVGVPRWNVELLKVRNGKPGTWQVEWTAEGFRSVPGAVINIPHVIRNVG